MPIPTSRRSRPSASAAVRNALLGALAMPSGTLTVGRRHDPAGDRLVVRAVSAAALPTRRPARFAGLPIDWEVIAPPRAGRW